MKLQEPTPALSNASPPSHKLLWLEERLTVDGDIDLARFAKDPGHNCYPRGEYLPRQKKLGL